MKNILNHNDFKLIQDRIAKLKPQSKNLWGKMNVNQMIRHVTNALKMCLGEVVVKPKGNAITHTLAKWVILAGMPAPKGKVKTIDVLDTVANEINPADLSTEKNNLLSTIERYYSSNQVYEHAVFGKL